MARSGMSVLISRLRRMVNDGTAGVWSDDDLQDTLDQFKIRVEREELEMEQTLTSSSTYEYKRFHSRWGDYEQGGSVYFKLEDSTGTQRGTADFTADYIRGVVTMTADQAGTKLYLSAWSYDLNAAAGELWRERAGQVASYYDVDTDGHRLSRSQWNKHCLTMAAQFESKARPVVVRSWRNGVFGD